MRESLVLQVAVFAVLFAVQLWLGPRTAQALGFCLVATMAAMIAATFLWLWRQRATPLALGMAFSWFGTATILTWLWIERMVGRPPWMADTAIVLVCLAFYITGAVHHFAVIRRSMGASSVIFVLPLIVVGSVAALILTRL